MTVEYNTELLHQQAIRLGLGNMDIARRAGVSPKTVKAALSGARVSRRSISRIIEALGIEPSSIIRPFHAPSHEARNARAGAVNSSRSKGGRACA